MDLFLDTSFIIPLIIETDTTRKARDFYSFSPGYMCCKHVSL